MKIPGVLHHTLAVAAALTASAFGWVLLGVGAPLVAVVCLATAAAVVIVETRVG